MHAAAPTDCRATAAAAAGPAAFAIATPTAAAAHTGPLVTMTAAPTTLQLELQDALRAGSHQALHSPMNGCSATLPNARPDSVPSPVSLLGSRPLAVRPSTARLTQVFALRQFSLCIGGEEQQTGLEVHVGMPGKSLEVADRQQAVSRAGHQCCRVRRLRVTAARHPVSGCITTAPVTAIVRPPTTTNGTTTTTTASRTGMPLSDRRVGVEDVE